MIYLLGSILFLYLDVSYVPVDVFSGPFLLLTLSYQGLVSSYVKTKWTTPGREGED